MEIIKRMNDRVETARHDSDTTLFMNLMYAGEQLTKIIVSAIVSGVGDGDGSKDRYSLQYDLVHADGLGVWHQSLEAALSGPSAHFAKREFNSFRNELTEKCANPSWQFGATFALNNCLKALNDSKEELPSKIQFKNWFSLFSTLRNDARAHGIINADQAQKICHHLETSIKLITENFSLFKTPWFYVKQNISGSYRLTALNSFANREEIQKQIDDSGLSEGIYIYITTPHRVELIESTIEATDFYFPNGNFRDKTYECISYISGRKLFADSRSYLRPPGQLPTSETQGSGELQVVNETFANLPSINSIYIARQELEDELKRILMFQDKYPIVTLSGRGGIGKTSLAIQVLHTISNTKRYSTMVWLSARDIDLMEEGPKSVKPQILNEDDIATEFARLIKPDLLDGKRHNSSVRDFVQAYLTDSSSLGPILLVLDNFETLRNPKQVFTWLDTYIRNPNKVFITSRLRDFKADYPIVVDGMKRVEYDELVDQVSTRLGIKSKLTNEFLDELYRESDGHPYVVKILLGEVTKVTAYRNVKRIVASKDEILTALFERTYSDLSQSAKRVFLTLSSWRNILPEIAVESVINREGNDLIDIEGGIDELFRFSFIEILKSTQDESFFLAVPLAAYEFGRGKLKVSPLKNQIQLDIEILVLFGVTNMSEVDRGIQSKLNLFFKNVTIGVKNNKLSIGKMEPILFFICRKKPQNWLTVCRMYQEMGKLGKSIECIQNFVADYRVLPQDKAYGWDLLSKLYLAERSYRASCQALAEICKIDNVDFYDLSNSLHSLINLARDKKDKLKKEETQLLLSSVADQMRKRVDSEGKVAEFTQLAWVYLYLENKPAAADLVKKALKLDPRNFHVQNLAKKIRNWRPRSN